MQPNHLFSVFKGAASPPPDRGTHARATSASSSAVGAAATANRQREEHADAPIAIAVGSSPPVRNEQHWEGQRHAKADAAVVRPVVIPPPPGVAASLPSSSSQPSEFRDDSIDEEMASTTQRLTGAEHSATIQLTSSPVDVPPTAVPASRYQGLYDGSLYLPPGTTKRALGRLRLVGCCVITQESWHATFVAVPILLFTVLFVTVVVPPGEWFSYLYTLVFAAGSLTCLTLSVTLDPGVIPPAPLSALPSGPTTVLVNGQVVECKVCKTCHILRPPRSSHCKFCNVCVEEYDHHCGILGSCVAKRTFRFFGGFFIITTFLALYVCIRSFVVVISTDFSQGNEDMHALAIAGGGVLCIFAAFMGGLLVIPCAARYIMLSATNDTTKETMRREQQESNQIPGCVPVEEIRSDNYLKNIFRRLFSPLGRSRIPFDYYV